MPLEIGDVVRIALTGWSPQASVWQNVWHMLMTTGASVLVSDLIDAVGANVALMHAEVDQVWSDQFSMQELEFWQYNFGTSKWNGVGVFDLGGLDGLHATDPMAHGVSAVGRYVNTVARRQGRTFLPGLIQTSIDAGLFDSAVIVAFALYMAEFTNVLSPTGGNFNLCTFNTDLESVYYETPSVYVGPAIVSLIPGYQRRRKPLVGL